MTDDQQAQPTEATEATDAEKTGGLAGVGAGVIAGAQLGTVVLPIPVVGTFTGALVGGIVGSKVGKKVGSAILGDRKPAEPAQPEEDLTAALTRLAALREQGVLSDEEFAAAKAKLLG